MARRKGELLVVEEAVQIQASDFLDKLWQGVRVSLEAETEKIQTSGLYPDSLCEANVAITMIDGWKELSRRMVEKPMGLTLRACGITRFQKLVTTNLPDGCGGTLCFEVKHSDVNTIVDGKPDHHRFSQSPEQGTPQLQVDVRELYQSSRAEILGAIAGIRSSQDDVGLTRPAERDFGKANRLETEAFFSGRIAARGLTLTGKTTWFDPRNQAIRTWDLAGFEVIEALASGVCPIDVKQRIKLGRLDDQTGIHPVAYDHNLLETFTPALFAAVEPFVRRVARIAQKGK